MVRTVRKDDLTSAKVHVGTREATFLSSRLRRRLNYNLEDVLSHTCGLAASVPSSPPSDVFACADAPLLKVLAPMRRGAFHLVSVSAPGPPAAPR